ncbi:MAG TPA: IS1380 family transposase [Lacipirellulaceae bacterium]|nr:IS1380 family transposase [Lacipirellulaceae bacterium]
MDQQSVFQITLDFFDAKPIVVEPTAGQLTSDAGLLPFRQLDEQLGLTRQFADALTDVRAAVQVDHTFLEMVRMRVYGILADYPDQNDHDRLRSDPLFKIVCDRSIGDRDLASQPTLSRFENAIDVRSFFRLEEFLLERFVASFSEPPRELTLDIDCFDDATHGQQQLTFFHGYYEQYQYLARAITCAENDLVLAICLLYGSAHPTLGAADDIERVVRRLRQIWPDVTIHVRGDSGFGAPVMYEQCEQSNVLYSFGLGMNSRLKTQSEETLNEALRRREETGQDQRLFCAFWYRAKSWTQARWVTVKCEVNAQGTNRRAVVSNRPGAMVMPAAAYEEYANRGESENRNKELKRGFEADRLSDHRYFANLFRLYLHTLSYTLLVHMRRLVANPPAEEPQQELPNEALAGRQRRRLHNHRRECDPLGEGHACTWRTRLIKVAAYITETSRRIVVRLSSSWPYLDHYQAVSQQVLAGASPNTS